MAKDLDQLAAFLRQLAQALHISGMPAHDLERHLNTLGQRLGVRVDCFAVLTMLTLNITAEHTTQRVEMLRLPSYDYNMARLIALEALLREIEGGDSLARCSARLEEIMSTPPRWTGWSLVGLGFLLSSSVAVLLGGGWTEVLCGGLIGMLFVAGTLALARVPRLAPAAPVLLCATAALYAHALTFIFPQQSPFITAVAGVVLLLPGFTLTIAMSELATQNLLSGTGRLAGVVLLAWAVFSLVSAVFGNVVGAFAGALAVAGAGHLYAYSTGQPDILVKIPGLIALVPGSMGFRGVHALIEQDNAVGVVLVTNMALTGAVLAVGLLLADNIAPLLFARRPSQKDA